MAVDRKVQVYIAVFVLISAAIYFVFRMREGFRSARQIAQAACERTYNTCIREATSSTKITTCQTEYNTCMAATRTDSSGAQVITYGGARDASGANVPTYLRIAQAYAGTGGAGGGYTAADIADETGLRDLYNTAVDAARAGQKPDLAATLLPNPRTGIDSEQGRPTQAQLDAASGLAGPSTGGTGSGRTYVDDTYSSRTGSARDVPVTNDSSSSGVGGTTGSSRSGRTTRLYDLDESSDLDDLRTGAPVRTTLPPAGLTESVKGQIQRDTTKAVRDELSKIFKENEYLYQVE